MSRNLIDPLESRALWSVSLDHGLLNIVGTPDGDRISVELTLGVRRMLEVSVNGVVTSFHAAAVSGLRISAGRGDDYIIIGNGTATRNVTVPATVYSGAGSDILQPLQNAPTRAYLGDGRDSLYAYNSFSRCTVYGEGGDDFLTAGHKNDLICGGAGSDDITSIDGRDTLDGGDGNDFITGSRQACLIVGGAGDDGLVGHYYGKNTLLGGAGNDGLSGGLGNDLLDGGDGEDDLDGREGNDTLIGGADNDDAVGLDATQSLSDNMPGDASLNINHYGDHEE